MTWGPWSKGRAAGLIPNADAGSSPAGSTRWACEHEQLGYLKGRAETLGWVAPMFSMLVALTSLVVRWPWVLAAVCFPLCALMMVASQLTYKRRWKLMEEGIGRSRALAEQAKASFLANVARADRATLEAIIGDTSCPEELRAELREQLARRRAGLN